MGSQPLNLRSLSFHLSKLRDTTTDRQKLIIRILAKKIELLEEQLGKWEARARTQHRFLSSFFGYPNEGPSRTQFENLMKCLPTVEKSLFAVTEIETITLEDNNSQAITPSDLALLKKIKSLPELMTMVLEKEDLPHGDLRNKLNGKREEKGIKKSIQVAEAEVVIQTPRRIARRSREHEEKRRRRDGKERRSRSDVQEKSILDGSIPRQLISPSPGALEILNDDSTQ